MAKKLIILASISIFIFAGLVLGAVPPKKLCSACKEEITKTDYYLFRNGLEVHFYHAFDELRAERNKVPLELLEKLKK